MTTGIGKGCNFKIYVKATTGPATTSDSFLEHINDMSLTFDGKTVEITEFAATCPTYVARATGIKDIKVVLSGYLEKAATGQAMLWANHISGTALFGYFGFGATGAEAKFQMGMNVDNIDIKTNTDGYQEVTYNISNYGTPTGWT